MNGHIEFKLGLSVLQKLIVMLIVKLVIFKFKVTQDQDKCQLIKIDNIRLISLYFKMQIIFLYLFLFIFFFIMMARYFD